MRASCDRPVMVRQTRLATVSALALLVAGAAHSAEPLSSSAAPWPSFGSARVEGTFADDRHTSVLVNAAAGTETVILNAKPTAPLESVDVVAAAAESAAGAADAGTAQAEPAEAATAQMAAQPKSPAEVAAPIQNAHASEVEIDNGSAGVSKPDAAPVDASRAAPAPAAAEAAAAARASAQAPLTKAAAPVPVAPINSPRSTAAEAAPITPAPVTPAPITPASAQTEAGLPRAAPAAAPDAAASASAASKDAPAGSAAATKDAPTADKGTDAKDAADAGKAAATTVPSSSASASGSGSADRKDAPAAAAEAAAPAAAGRADVSGVTPAAGTAKSKAEPRSHIADEVAHPKADYYDQRAAAVLKADAEAESTDGLQKQYPEHTMVSCIAGCGNGKAEVIYVSRNSDIVSAETGEVVPTSTDAGAPAAEPAITCVAGCYDKPRQRYHSPSRAEIDDSLKRSAERRLSGRRAATRGDSWLSTAGKRGEDRAATAASAAGAAKSAAPRSEARSSSNRWVTHTSRSRSIRIDW